MKESENIIFHVRVTCLTYNHAPYIVDTMNGFVIQNTEFPYVCIIVDDASNDGEPEIIKKYLQEHFDLEDKNIVRNEESNDYVLTFAKHKTNQNCYFAVYFLKYNHYRIKKSIASYIAEWKENTKYIAICEGDDYWTNSNKLQKQTAFLDHNPDYSMCFGDVFIHHTDGNKTDFLCSKYYRKANGSLNVSKRASFYNILLNKCRIQTLTAVIRAECFLNRKPDNHRFMMADTQIWFDMSQMGRIGYLDECLGVYNVHVGSATNNSSTRKRFTFSAKEMCIYYCNKYGYYIPFLKKVEYNLAYYDLLIHSANGINPPALFPPFAYNKLHIFLRKIISEKFRLKLMKFTLPMESFIYIVFLKIRLFYWQIVNMFN